MPIYNYECKLCGKITEHFQLMNDPDIPAKTDFANMSQEEFSEYSKFAVVFWNKLCGFDVEEQFETHRF